MKTKISFFMLLGVMTLGAISSCNNSSLKSEFDITYPETGKYGPNILAEGFVGGISYENGRYNDYSVRAVPAKSTSLKIVIKSAKPIVYECRNYLPSYLQPDICLCHLFKFVNRRFVEFRSAFTAQHCIFCRLSLK